jgi:hypothetical protein
MMPQSMRRRHPRRWEYSMAIRTDDLDRFMGGVQKRNPGELEFH